MNDSQPLHKDQYFLTEEDLKAGNTSTKEAHAEHMKLRPIPKGMKMLSPEEVAQLDSLAIETLRVTQFAPPRDAESARAAAFQHITSRLRTVFLMEAANGPVA